MLYVTSFTNQCLVLKRDKREEIIYNYEYNDNNNWQNTRQNKVRTIKDDLMIGKLTTDTEIIENTGINLLHQSIALNREELFTLAILFKSDVNKKTSTGMRPMDIACSLGRLQMVQKLIEQGAEIDYQDPTGKSPYERAEFFGHFDVCEYLQQFKKKE